MMINVDRQGGQIWHTPGRYSVKIGPGSAEMKELRQHPAKDPACIPNICAPLVPERCFSNASYKCLRTSACA